MCVRVCVIFVCASNTERERDLGCARALAWWICIRDFPSRIIKTHLFSVPERISFSITCRPVEVAANKWSVAFVSTISQRATTTWSLMICFVNNPPDGSQQCELSPGGLCAIVECERYNVCVEVSVYRSDPRLVFNRNCNSTFSSSMIDA